MRPCAILFSMFFVLGCSESSANDQLQTSAEHEELDEGKRLAKNDPRFKPYVAKRHEALDFSNVDVGDEPFAEAPTSIEDLGQAIVAALNERSTDGLTKLSITEDEYKARFFPVLVHHRAALKMGAELVWAELRGESSGDVRTAVERYGGQSLSFEEVTANEVLSRPKVRIHKGIRVNVKTAEGEPLSLVMLGSIVEHVPSSTFRVLAFRDTK